MEMGGGGARLGTGLAGGNAELVLLPEAGTGCTQLSKVLTPMQMDRESVGPETSMADWQGRGGLSKKVEEGTKPGECAVHLKGTSAKFQTGLVCCLSR